MSLLPRGLYARVAVPVCAIVTATVVSYGWVTSRQQGAMLEAALRAEAAAHTETIAETSMHHLVVSDYASLEELVLEVAELANIVGVQVVEPDGRGLVNVAKAFGARPRKVGGPFRLQPPEGMHPVLLEEGGRVVTWHPIVAGGTLGWVRVTSDLGEVAQARAAIWRSSLILGLLWVAGGSTLLLLLLRPTARDIRRLAAFARTLGERKGGRVELAEGPAEITELETALNAASAELLAREQALLAERERLEVTLRSIGEAVVVTDTAGAVVLMNNVAEQLTGWPAAEALGRPVVEICRLAVERDGPPPEHPAIAALGPDGVCATPDQTVLVPREGLPRSIVANSAPIRDAQGRVLGTITVVRDISERASLERQLRQAQKMEAVGQLAGGIAHDFNNILSAIIGYGSIMLIRMPPQDPLRDHVAQILQAAERAANLTQSLLTFSRKQVMALRTEDLNGVVRGIDKILRRLIPENIALQVGYCDGEIPVTVDRGQIEQVLFNLVTNARDATAGGGEIRVSTARIPPDGAGGSGWATLTVEDTGAGMSREVRDKIFDPFFTTKEVGKGTGLGLAMVYGIISQHRGRITVESEPGAGATFRVHLPLAGAVSAAEKPAAAAPVRGGSETILLVEDDAAVRAVTETMLRDVGYAVASTADGEECLKHFREDPDRFDLVLSDVVMPGCCGGELLRRLRELRPGVVAVFMSGYTADAATRELIADAGVPLLSKPVQREVLLRAVRAAIDARPRRKERAAASPAPAPG